MTGQVFFQASCNQQTVSDILACFLKHRIVAIPIEIFIVYECTLSETLGEEYRQNSRQVAWWQQFWLEYHTLYRQQALAYSDLVLFYKVTRHYKLFHEQLPWIRVNGEILLTKILVQALQLKGNRLLDVINILILKWVCSISFEIFQVCQLNLGISLVSLINNVSNKVTHEFKLDKWSLKVIVWCLSFVEFVVRICFECELAW